MHPTLGLVIDSLTDATKDLLLNIGVERRAHGL